MRARISAVKVVSSDGTTSKLSLRGRQMVSKDDREKKVRRVEFEKAYDRQRRKEFGTVLATKRTELLAREKTEILKSQLSKAECNLNNADMIGDTASIELYRQEIYMLKTMIQAYMETPNAIIRREQGSCPYTGEVFCERIVINGEVRAYTINEHYLAPDGGIPEPLWK